MLRCEGSSLYSKLTTSLCPLVDCRFSDEKAQQTRLLSLARGGENIEMKKIDPGQAGGREEGEGMNGKD